MLPVYFSNKALKDTSEFLNNYIFIFTFHHFFLLFFFFFYFFFIQNFENKIYMFRYLNNPSANTMKPLQ